MFSFTFWKGKKRIAQLFSYNFFEVVLSIFVLKYYFFFVFLLINDKIFQIVFVNYGHSFSFIVGIFCFLHSDFTFQANDYTQYCWALNLSSVGYVVFASKNFN